MLILLTIFLFLFVPLLMLIFYLVRPRFNAQGFLAVLVVLAGWILIFFARADIPRNVALLQWKPESLFDLSPVLLIDSSSWYFALALASLGLSVVITSIAQLGLSSIPNPVSPQMLPQTEASSEPSDAGKQTVQSSPDSETQIRPAWSLWASILIISSLGLLAVTAGNLLTLLLAWAALDILELIILLSQVELSKMRERIVLAFSARMAGISIVLIAGVLLWSHGTSMTFEGISGGVSTYLVIAAGLRLGVIPLHLPYTKGIPINHNLGTVLRLIPATSSYILLVRVSNIGIAGAITPYLLGLTILAGVYAAINWLRARDEVEGRPYWLLATSSLVVAAAILRAPAACLAWSIASLLSGGLIFSMSLHHKNMMPLALLGLINLSALPFSPTWQITSLYQLSPTLAIDLTVFSTFSFFFLLIQSFITAGFIRHSFRGILSSPPSTSMHIERWVWFLYPLGLIFIVITHGVIGWWMYPNIHDVPLLGWIVGPAALILTGIILYFSWRFPNRYPPVIGSNLRSTWDRFFSLEWLYISLWRIFRTVTRVFSLVSSVLEGEGGLLWALVLFGLIFVFLQR